MDTALEVSVTREDGRGDQIVVDNAVLHLVSDLTGVADASHATVTSCSEAELVEVALNTGLLVVLSDDVGAW